MAEQVDRTIDLTTAGARFREGPIDVRAHTIASVDVVDAGPTKLSSGVVGLIAGAARENMEALTPGTINNATRVISAINGTGGVKDYALLDGDVSTAQSGVVLGLRFHLERLEG